MLDSNGSVSVLLLVTPAPLYTQLNAQVLGPTLTSLHANHAWMRIVTTVMETSNFATNVAKEMVRTTMLSMVSAGFKSHSLAKNMLMQAYQTTKCA